MKEIIIHLKAFLRMTFCRFIFYTGLLDLYIKHVFLKRKKFPAVIINYHSFVLTLDNVIEVESSVVHRMDSFYKEIQWLKKYFDIVPLDRVVETINQGKLFEKPTIAITIDDGFRDNYDLLFPYLQKENVPVTIFLTAGLIGTNQKIWIDQLAQKFHKSEIKEFVVPEDLGGGRYRLDSIQSRRNAYNAVSGKLKALSLLERNKMLLLMEEQLNVVLDEQPVMLNWDQVRKMNGKNVCFGAHSCTHPILTSLTLEEAKKEIADSKKIIEEKLGEEIKHFAYPNGRAQDFNEELRQYCKEIGLKSVSTAEPMGNNSELQDVWALKRIGAKIPISFCAFHVMQAFLKK